MFVVGLDVDTIFFEVSSSVVTHFIIIWLYAGNFRAVLRPPRVNLVGKIVASRRRDFLTKSARAVNNQQVTFP